MRRVAAVLGLALAAAGCTGRQSALDPAGAEAGAQFDMMTLLLGVCGIMYLLVLGFLAMAIWRAFSRRREAKGPDTAPLVPGPERGLQLTLTGWTGLILAGLLGLTVATFLVDRGLTEPARGEPLHVRMTGNQWWWRVEYPDGGPSQQFETANELHLPVNRTTVLELNAADVIHSFWAPNLAGKTDLIPGRVNRLRLTPTRSGVFRAQCAEFCGLEHARMALDIVVETPAQFAAWQARQRTPSPSVVPVSAARGRDFFTTRACANCHHVGGAEANGRTAPDLTHVASRRTIAAGTLPTTRGSFAAWIADPQGIKPGANMPAVPMTPSELNDVVDYLETLR